MRRPLARNDATARQAAPQPRGASPSPTWQSIGPDSVLTPGYGAVSGRVAALALDPADPTGNTLYAGTTGGGVWKASNAASATAQVAFAPLTDSIAGLSTAQDASISIGALTVQPGGTGVVLAGTGDPNDALDSYYGAGILRSADGGQSWSLIATTADNNYSFAGEGFAGFAWSTTTPRLVVAAVSQAYEGTLVDATLNGRSYEGLYYSADAGATWTLATIEDGAGSVVQGPGAALAQPDGNAATSVVWNAVRGLFIAAVRFHGYYQSTDGITFTRLADQPGNGFNAAYCPVNAGSTGSIDCPIFRGTLAVNPETGDTFAWSVDIDNQDQGLWQDACSIAGGVCTNQTVTFPGEWDTTALETDTGLGPATIANGDYNLALAAVPYALQAGADTWLLAGANDLWRCSLAAGCVWRNTTNAATCMSAEVGPFQHALEWNRANPLEVMIGNDSGLWRSMDVVGEGAADPPCASTDASHFQNLNGGLGSLAEVDSLATSNAQYVMMAGLGVNGATGLKSATAATAQWPQILGGNGGPVAIDPRTTANWYVNDQDGVAIYLCYDPSTCTSADFGTTPVVTDADVGGDGDGMGSPAPFLVDPLDTTQLLIGTCRVWRGPASGAAWSDSDAMSPILDSGATGVPCAGDSLIRALAAQAVSGQREVVYAGLYGNANGSLPGHVFSATIDPADSTMPVWTDLTANPVTNTTKPMNAGGFDISSISIDPHDATGNTVYVTVEAFSTAAQQVQTVYGSTDGGAHWASLTANLPLTPVSAVIVDPQSAATLYLATDAGVYFTTAASSCSNPGSACWTLFGTGLPGAPVVALSAAPPTAAAQVLTAATYGRGIWQTPLWTAGSSVTTASVSPTSLAFASQVFGTASQAQSVTLTNTGSAALTPTTIAVSGDFSESDNCAGRSIAPAASCTVQVTFTPTATGSRSGQLLIAANVYGGQLSVPLAGTGAPGGALSVTPATLVFDASPAQNSALPPVLVGSTSQPFQVTVNNAGSAPVPVSSISVTPPFAVSSNACGTSSFAAQTSCTLAVTFTPTQAGAVAGTLSLVDGAGTQTVQLSGFGYAPATDQLNPASLAFPQTALGQTSAPLPVLVTNTGDVLLTQISAATTTGFAVSSTCGTQLSPHAGCTFNVAFAPTQLGSQTGTLTVTDALRVQTVALSGTAVQAALLTANPAMITFPTETLGAAAAPIVVTIGNSGGAAANNLGFTLTGAAAASFSIGGTTCPGSLAAGASCTVQLLFTPTTAGASAASLVISASGGVMPLTVPINGSALAASGLNASPTQLSFGAVVVGSPSPAQTVTISNSSNAAASGLTLTPTAGFTLTQNTCAASLAGGATCTVGVFFTPVGTGPTNGQLIVSSATIGNMAVVTLAGSGGAASGIQITPASLQFATTGVGQSSAPVTVNVANTGVVQGLSGLSLAVSSGFTLTNNTCPVTLPPGASCTAQVVFAPGAAGPATGTLTVSSSTLSATAPLNGAGFDFTVTFSGSNTQTVAAGLTADYTLVITPLGGSTATYGIVCDSLPTNAACAFNPGTQTLSSGVTGNTLVQVSTGTALGSATTSAGGLAGAMLACAVLLLPAGLGRARRILRAGWLAILFAAALTLAMAGLTSCAKSGGGGASNGGSGGTSGPGTVTAAGTYSIPIAVSSMNVTHNVTLTLTVE